MFLCCLKHLTFIFKSFSDATWLLMIIFIKQFCLSCHKIYGDFNSAVIEKLGKILVNRAIFIMRAYPTFLSTKRTYPTKFTKGELSRKFLGVVSAFP